MQRHPGYVRPDRRNFDAVISLERNLARGRHRRPAMGAVIREHIAPRRRMRVKRSMRPAENALGLPSSRRSPLDRAMRSGMLGVLDGCSISPAATRSRLSAPHSPPQAAKPHSSGFSDYRITGHKPDIRAARGTQLLVGMRKGRQRGVQGMTRLPHSASRTKSAADNGSPSRTAAGDRPTSRLSNTPIAPYKSISAIRLSAKTDLSLNQGKDTWAYGPVTDCGMRVKIPDGRSPAERPPGSENSSLASSYLAYRKKRKTRETACAGESFAWVRKPDPAIRSAKIPLQATQYLRQDLRATRGSILVPHSAYIYAFSCLTANREVSYSCPLR